MRTALLSLFIGQTLNTKQQSQTQQEMWRCGSWCSCSNPGYQLP